MAGTISIRYEPEDDDPIAGVTVLAVEAIDCTVNATQDAEGIEDAIPAAAIRRYLTAEASGVDTLTSPRFEGADFTWDNVVIPEAGSWTFHIRLDADDSSEANSGAVTVAEDA